MCGSQGNFNTFQEVSKLIMCGSQGNLLMSVKIVYLEFSNIEDSDIGGRVLIG